MPIVRCSPSNPALFKTGFKTKYEWDCFAQCGGGGGKNDTFFFEAFPDYGMIRADSKVSMEDAEEKAWAKHQKTKACPLDHKDHKNLDRKDYTNGCAFCKGCNQWITSDYSGLEPSVHCEFCGKASCYSGLENPKGWCCEECLPKTPDNRLSVWQLDQRYKRGLFAEEKPSQEEFKKALGEVLADLVKPK